MDREMAEWAVNYLSHPELVKYLAADARERYLMELAWNKDKRIEEAEQREEEEHAAWQLEQDQRRV